MPNPFATIRQTRVFRIRKLDQNNLAASFDYMFQRIIALHEHGWELSGSPQAVGLDEADLVIICTRRISIWRAFFLQEEENNNRPASELRSLWSQRSVG